MTESDLAKAIVRMQARTAVDENGCWLYQGAKNKAGYGNVHIAGTVMNAHKLSFLYHHGQLSAGMEVRHNCDVRNCWSPNHLEQGTHAQNIRDVFDRQRWQDERFKNLMGTSAQDCFDEPIPEVDDCPF